MEPRIYRSWVTRLRNIFRRNWQLLLHWREQLVFKEEAFHLVLAALVGFIGGLVNLFFFYAGEMVQRLFLPQPIDPVQAAEMFAPWQRLAVPTLGGLAAGLILGGGPPGPPCPWMAVVKLTMPPAVPKMTSVERAPVPLT